MVMTPVKLQYGAMACRTGSIFRLAASAMLVAALLLGGCIKNNIPYPRIQPDILSIEADGLQSPAEIDASSRLVVLRFDETVDISNVNITSYSLSEGATIVKNGFDDPIDLSKYYIVTLKYYQEYDWVIQGVQEIERYFTVENQIGSTIIDVTGRRVVVTLPESQGLGNVKVLTMKLGSTNSVSTPFLEGTSINLTRPVEVTVETYGREETWTIYGETASSNVTTVRADGWTKVAWVYGSAIEGHDNGVEYRVKGDDEWMKVDAGDVVHTGGTFRALLKGLTPETDYETRAYSDDEAGSVVEFTTGSIAQVPNSNLSEWSQSGKVWNPWAEGDTPYWDTGNKGATTLGDSNSTPTTDTSTGAGQCARLETVFVGIGAIGKLAAGNIFVGSYVRTDGTNGVLSFGRPFTERPTAMRCYLKYTSTPISHTNSEWAHLKGEPDTCSVYMALLDSSQPYEIRTNPSDRKLFDSNGSSVVAYGSFQSGESIQEYTMVDITLDYRATNRVPTYLMIVATASKYGDYFTGGNGSVLYIDRIELLYDY